MAALETDPCPVVHPALFHGRFLGQERRVTSAALMPLLPAIVDGSAQAFLLATLAVPRLRPWVLAAAVPLVAGQLLVLQAGLWPGMPLRVANLALLLLLPWLLTALWARAAWCPLEQMMRALARGGGFLYAGFWLALGVQSLRNGAPLAATTAVHALLLAILLLLLPFAARRPLRHAGIALLAAVALSG